jgi:hypothetical protein
MSLPAYAADEAVRSGFLPDYSKLQPVEGKEGVQRHIDRSVDVRAYNKIYIDPVQVVVSTDNGYRGVQPDAMKRMADSFRDAFVKAVSPTYQVVGAPAPDALSIRLAITGMQPVSPPLGASDFIPIKAIFNLGRAAAGTSAKVAELSAELEVLDGQGRQVATAVATRKSEANLPQADRITWNDLAPIVDAWARNFRQGLDELKGSASPR